MTMIITDSQAAYFEHLVPGVLNEGHLALLEEREAGETIITSLGVEIGHVTLDGFRLCEIVISEDPELSTRYASYAQTLTA